MDNTFRSILRRRRHRSHYPADPPERGTGSPAPWRPADIDGLRRGAYGDALTWLGHSCFLLQLQSRNLLLDPMLTHYAAPIHGVVRRQCAPGLLPREIPPLDAVVVSHNHYDHLDHRTVRHLNRTAHAVVPLGVAPWFSRRAFRRVTELDRWDSTELAGGIRATLVPAQHGSGRGPFSINRSLWGGVVLETPGLTVYYAGDTGYFAGFHQIRDRFPRIDLAILPIGAYDPAWFMKPIHLNPEEAGEAFLDLGARAFVPCHWGTFILSREPMDEPPRRLRAWWNQQGLEPERLRVMAVGETLPLKPP